MRVSGGGGSAANPLIPLFPLHAVLFPGGLLELRIFEPRYLDMVSDCLRTGSGFGICLIREGPEVGAAATPYPIGTYGRISYWQRRRDGLLGITVRGERRFRILSTEVHDNQLLIGQVAMLPAEASQPLAPHHRDLSERLKGILEQLGQPYAKMPKYYEDAQWVGARLAELLPLPLQNKQHLLQMTDPMERLARLQAMIDAGIGCL